MKGKILLLLFAAIFVLFTPKSEAQDPHLAQFYAAPVSTNPAMIGVFNGRFRVVANYREQWASIINDNPFRTVGASFEIRHRVGRNDFMAYSVNAMRDEAGSSSYTRTNGNFGFSYMKQLGGGGYSSTNQYLIAGAQLGAGQHGIDPGSVWFSSQFNTTTEEIDMSLSSGEMINSQSDVYLDFNAGLMWYATFDDNLSIYAGGALHHLNAPRISFVEDGGEVWPMRWLAQAGGEVPFTDELSLLPAVIFQKQGTSLNTIFGANFRYTNSDWREVAIRVGAWGDIANRLDAETTFPGMIFTAILEMDRWNLGFSYDVNSGDLSAPTNARGAFEMSLIYVHPASRKERVKCPKF